MEQNELKEEYAKTGSAPDYVSDDAGIRIWINKTRDGNDYASVQIFGKKGLKINCFKPNRMAVRP